MTAVYGTARLPRAAKRQEGQKSHAAAYRAAPHHYTKKPYVQPASTAAPAERRAARQAGAPLKPAQEKALARKTARQLQGIARAGRDVSRAIAASQAAGRRAKALEHKTVTIGGFKQPAILAARDPKVLAAAGFTPPGVGEKLIQTPAHAITDVGELAVTTPTTIAHQLALEGRAVGKSVSQRSLKPLGKAQVQLGKEMLAPYKEALKHPLTFATQHPVSAYLMFSPGAKIPLRGVGRAARLAGKQSLRRAGAELPGTALRATRRDTRHAIPVGVREIAKRRRQVREERAGTPTVSKRELQRRVDEHRDLAQHNQQHIVAEHLRAAKKATKGQPRQVRREALAAAHEAGTEVARVQSQEAFAREFGANVEPSTSFHEVSAAKLTRTEARAAKGAARKAREQAEKAFQKAHANARAARGRSRRTAQLDALEAERRVASGDLARAQREHGRADVGLAEAKGRAAVSQTRLKSSPRLLELKAQHRTIERKLPADEVKAATRAVRESDRFVNTVSGALQRAEERGSHLEGVTVGRARAGRMTAGAGRAAADQAERVGQLRDALQEARRGAADAREHLTQVTRAHRGRVREATKAVGRQVAAEQRRIGGVAPVEHQGLLGAIERRADAPARVHDARARVRELDRRIATERSRTAGVPPVEADALLRAIHQRDAARSAEKAAGEQHGLAKRIHIDLSKAHRAAGLVNPEGAGRLFTSERDAKKVAQQLNAQGHEVPVGGLSTATRRQVQVHEPGAGNKAVTIEKGEPTTPLTFKIRKVGEDHWAVLPKAASERMYGGGGRASQLSHASVGTSKATGSKLMRTSRGQFTQAVLPLSPKWLAGQGVEAGIRALVAGAGPLDFLRFKRVVKRMNEHEKGSGDEFARRILGGQFGSTSAVAENLGGQTLAHEFQGTPLRGPAALATRVGETAPMRVGKAGWRRYTSGVMHGVNGFVENTARKAMTGQEIRGGPLMERRLMGLTDKAIDQAARGLKGTAEQVEAAREVDKMYGRYSKWSPEMRSLLMHWTPFLPWYLNTAQFLFHTLPTDHPAKAALLADMNQADAEWRKRQRLSLQGPHVPDFLLGSYPTGGDRYLRVAHYTPWGVGTDPTGSAGSLLLPQVVGPTLNAFGVDWRGHPLTKKGGKPFNVGDKTLRALVTGLEEQVPLVSQVGQISGLTPRYIDKRTSVRSPTESLKGLLPTTPTAEPKKRSRKKSSSGGGGGFGGGGGGGGFGGGSGSGF